jgi:hypothetical protein
MDIRIKLYLTTRTDPVCDLDEVKDLSKLRKWRTDVTPHAVRIIDLGQLDNELIDNLQGPCTTMPTLPGRFSNIWGYSTISAHSKQFSRGGDNGLLRQLIVGCFSFDGILIMFMAFMLRNLYSFNI